jgi:hypothetical protein
MNWSMKSDRQLVALSRVNLSVDQIAAKMKIDPKRVLKVAKRLGIQLAPVVKSANKK